MYTNDPLSVSGTDLEIRTLGPARFASPLAGMLATRRESVHYVDEDDRVLLDDTLGIAARRGVATERLPAFEPGGPRRMLYFDPPQVRAGIVTCGGLCPGLNDVIRGIVLQLAGRYGVREIVGFRDGYRGLVAPLCDDALPLTPESVRDIHARGGSILGTSRGGQDPDAMLDSLLRRGINVLFVVGGDGTLRGAAAIAERAERRGVPLAVVGIPKTIDNDIPYIDHSFGFQTAFARAAESIRAAHTEAASTPNGVGLVKLMGRHSGFIASYATLANHNVDIVLVPEVPFKLEGEDGVLSYLRRQVQTRGHAVMVVAEGAGQDLLHGGGVDASGNARLADIGGLLRERIANHFERSGTEVNIRYVDPGYAIRSVPANGYDGVYCIRLAHAAVHAALAGRTSMLVGRWHGRFVHLPISLVTRGRNVIDPDGDLWMSVLEATGQPALFGAGSGA
jgi:6-phosphofructokinase 1